MTGRSDGAVRTAVRRATAIARLGAAGIALASAGAVAPAPAAAAETPLAHVRGMILGKTPESMDVELGHGLARIDQRFEMPADARVYVASPASGGTLRVGTLVGVAFARGSRARTVVVYPADRAGRPDRAIARDLAAGSDGLATGVVVAATARRAHGTVRPTPGALAVLVTGSGHGAERRVAIDPRTAVVALARGGIADLATESLATITAAVPGSSAEDVLRSAVVGAGGFVPPI